MCFLLCEHGFPGIHKTGGLYPSYPRACLGASSAIAAGSGLSLCGGERVGYNVRMKRGLVFTLMILTLLGCGGGSSSFSGTWTGSFTSLQNDCPFTVNSDVNPLFPMVVSVDANDVYTVVAVDGSVATGGQGEGENISFLANAPVFGNYGSTSPYTCTSSESEVGYLAIGDTRADVTLTIYFNSCTTPDTVDDPISCAVIYFGDADKVSE